MTTTSENSSTLPTAAVRIDAKVNADDRSTTPQFIVTAEGDLLGEDTLENRETVRRISACVAACEGLTTADLEAGIVNRMTTLVAELTPILNPGATTAASATATPLKRAS